MFRIAPALSVLLLASCVSMAPSHARSRWSSDATAFIHQLRKTHPKPNHFTSIASLERAAAKVGTGAEPIAELAELVAMVGDGHTILPILTLPFDGVPAGPATRLLPLRLEWFDDGLFIVGADRRHAALIGGKVESIGGVTASESLRRVMRLLPTQRRASPPHMPPSGCLPRS